MSMEIKKMWNSQNESKDVDMALLEAAYRKEAQTLLSSSAKATEYTTQA